MMLTTISKPVLPAYVCGIYTPYLKLPSVTGKKTICNSDDSKRIKYNFNGPAQFFGSRLINIQ
jgi:hypothetical protein